MTYKEALIYMIQTGCIVKVEEFDTALKFNELLGKFQSARIINGKVNAEFTDCHIDAWRVMSFSKIHTPVNQFDSLDAKENKCSEE